MSDDVKEVYLGDGLYASWDGFQFRLRAPREGTDFCVFMEPQIIGAFADYVERTLKKAVAPVAKEPDARERYCARRGGSCECTSVSECINGG